MLYRYKNVPYFTYVIFKIAVIPSLLHWQTQGIPIPAADLTIITFVGSRKFP